MANIKGQFSSAQETTVSYSNSPGVGDTVWIDASTDIMYIYDGERGKWLSGNRHTLEFNRRGVADGRFIPIMGDLDHPEDFYIAEDPSTIVGVYCRSRTGSTSKTFQILVNDVSAFEFSYSGDDRKYINTTADIDLGKTDRVQLFVSDTGGNTINPFCRFEIARRYDV